MFEGDLVKMDAVGLTPCKCSVGLCPAPMTCLRRKGSKTEGQAMNLRTIGEKNSDCLFYVPVDAIVNEEHIFRNRTRGGRRHNLHAPPAGSSREPNLMVKRHIKEGRNIYDD